MSATPNFYAVQTMQSGLVGTIQLGLGTIQLPCWVPMQFDHKGINQNIMSIHFFSLFDYYFMFVLPSEKYTKLAFLCDSYMKIRDVHNSWF